VPRQQWTRTNYNGRPKITNPRTNKKSRRFTLSQAESIERAVINTIETLRHLPKKSVRNNTTKTATTKYLNIPNIRDCNAALAAFGDAGDLLRALRLFGKLRKAAAYCHALSPTLVTYSTLMSRANNVHRPSVAIRLFRLMQLAAELEPDTRACNILLHAYAQLARLDKAKALVLQMKQQQPATTTQTTNQTYTATDSSPSLDSSIKLYTNCWPNLVTFNTLLDCAAKAGDLQAALDAKQDMEQLRIRPDQRTYTSLLQVADSSALALELLNEMQSRGIAPNGMTYSAYIDASCRHGRNNTTDLALQGLRRMLRQKAQQNGVMSNEVGAWTAAIHALGRAGRCETALKLFASMQKFGCAPNTITCGCLTDSLLRAGRTMETLEVLRYMKSHGLVPSEVMYTSLITRAESLVQLEKNKFQRENKNTAFEKQAGTAKAIDVYTELMQSLVDAGRPETTTTVHTTNKKTMEVVNDDDPDNTLLLKVFLVFQEMKNVGAEPDLACFNALLRACARAGDVIRAHDVIAQICVAGLDPNDTSWRQLIAAGAKAGKSQIAVASWKQGIAYQKYNRNADEPARRWTPSVDAFGTLISAYLREGANAKPEDKARLYNGAIDVYEKLLLGDESMGFDRLDLNAVLDNQKTMLTILQAFTHLYDQTFDENKLREISSMACSILDLDCFIDIQPGRLAWDAYQALLKIQSWKDGEKLLKP
jgi:pentatricopeptide repeat protein